MQMNLPEILDREIRDYKLIVIAGARCAAECGGRGPIRAHCLDRIQRGGCSAQRISCGNFVDRGVIATECGILRLWQKTSLHSHVRSALEKDGWKITDDPLLLPWGTAPVYVDLGAEKIIAAEKNDRSIAVEVKSFLRGSRTEDLEDAMGQIVLYRYLLQRSQPGRELFLAVRQDVYESYISLPHVMEFLRAEQVNLLVFDPQTEEVVQWIK